MEGREGVGRGWVRLVGGAQQGAAGMGVGVVKVGGDLGHAGGGGGGGGEGNAWGLGLWGWRGGG